jgi:hypothetical protein
MKKTIEVNVAEDRVGSPDELIKVLRHIGRELRLQRRDAEATTIARCAQSLLEQLIKEES